MSRTRKAGVVTTMWVIGLAMLVGFVWLVHWRTSSPVHASHAADAPAAVSAEQPLAALTAGVTRSTGTAREKLQADERSAAAHALDAALRGAEVGHANSHGEAKTAYTIGLKKIRAAREALHLGREDETRRELARATAALQRAIEPSGKVSPSPPPAAVWDGYHSAVLLSPEGAMIGRVQRIEGGEAATAVLHIGGANDLFGFFELGGSAERIALDRVLWGPRRSLGSVYAVLPGGQPAATAAQRDGPRSANIPLSSTAHGAGRRQSRHQPARSVGGRQLRARLEKRGIAVRGASWRGVPEQVPDAYKDIASLVHTSERAGLARAVAGLTPLGVVKR